MKITIIAEKERVELTADPFKLLKKIDFSGLQAEVNIAKSGADGGLYLSSRYDVRDFVIEGALITKGKTPQWIQSKRDLLTRICNPRTTIQIELKTDTETLYLNAVPNAFPTFSIDRKDSNSVFQTFMLEFVSPDPFLYRQQKIVTFASTNPLFSFPMTFNNVVMGEVNSSYIRSLYNDGSMDCPVEIQMKALQSVVNPQLINVNTQEVVKLNTTLQAGDEVVINTGRKKTVDLIRNGIKTNFFSALDLNSPYLQLSRGDNVYRYNADSGIDFLKVEVRFQERKAGI